MYIFLTSQFCKVLWWIWGDFYWPNLKCFLGGLKTSPLLWAIFFFISFEIRKYSYFSVHSGILSAFRDGLLLTIIWTASRKKNASMHTKYADSEQLAHAQSTYVSYGPLLSILAFCSVQWFCQRTVKALIRLRGCTGWSGHLLSAYAQNMFSHGAAHI